MLINLSCRHAAHSKVNQNGTDFQKVKIIGDRDIVFTSSQKSYKIQLVVVDMGDIAPRVKELCWVVNLFFSVVGGSEHILGKYLNTSSE